MSITGRIINHTSQQKNHQQVRTINHRPQQGKLCVSYRKLTTPVTQSVRNRHHPKHSFFSNRLLFKTIPFNLPFSTFLFIVLDLPTAFAIACFSQIAVSLIFLNKPNFAGKIISYFIFKINILKSRL